MSTDGTGPLALDGMTGRTLADKYRLVRVLGSGAMGHVYQAEQVGLGRSVAVKILRGALAHSETSVERFRTEALAASRINHPNAIAIFDFGVTPDGVPYLVMEYLRGRTLANLIDERPFAAQRAIQVGAQILSAVEEAHSCGVVHRDLKSDNVIVEPLRDGNDFIKVLDFGVARLLDLPSSENVVAGTPEYMSPEQIRGEEVGPAADLYAVGILLYEMMVGRTPFSGAATQVVLERHLEDAPIPPEDIVPTCPRALSAVILRALAKEAGARWGSAGEMRAALLATLDAGETVSCATCGARQPAGVRFCATCGASLAGLAQGTVPPGSRAGSGQTSAETVPATPRESTAATHPVAEPAGARATRGSRLTSHSTQTTEGLIGRAEEVRRLSRFFQGDGTGALAVVGPVGIGRSRLVLDVARRFAPGIVTFVAGPDPSGFRLPWYPMLSMLEAVLGLPAVPSADDIAAAAARCGLPERDAPGLIELFGRPGPLASMELAARRRETHAAAVRAMRAVSHRFPRAVLCFVDIDRYDRPSRQLLASLNEALDGGGARMLLTSVDTESCPPGIGVMPLGGLAPADVRTLVAERAPGRTLPPADVIHELTGGSPAAAQQLAGWLIMGNDPSSTPRLVDLVGERLGQLSVHERRVLQVVAAHGQVAPRARVEAMLDLIDPQGVSRASLAAAGLLLADEQDYKIPFELVASVVAAATPAEVRRALSAAALETFDEATPPGIVGHHADIAGQHTTAVECFVAAGDDAVRRFDDAGAASWYGRAIVAARRLQGHGDAGGDEWFIDASLRLADALRYVGETRLALGCLAEAELAEPDVAQQAGIARARGRIALAAGDARAAVAHLQQAIGLALRAGDRDFLCDSYIDLATALSRLGDARGAATELSEAIDTITLGEGLARANGPPRLWLLGFRLADLLFRAGHHAAAERAATDALALAQRAHHDTGQGRLHALLATIVEATGQTQRAVTHRAQALDHLRRLGDRRATAELLVACARSTGDIPPVVASYAGLGERKLTPLRAMQIAADLAGEVGWNGGAH